MRARILAVAAAVAAWGCENAAAPQPGQTGSCTAVLSGALTGTWDCRPAYTQFDSATGLSDFGFDLPASGTRPAIFVAVEWVGVPMVATYSSADSGASASLLVTSSGNQWSADVGSGSPVGSYQLTLTSVAKNGVTSGGVAYKTDGSLAATLPASAGTGASGTINLSITF